MMHPLTKPALTLITAAAALAILLLPVTGRAAGDVPAGKLLFEKRCTGCHALDRNKEGPRLAGVFGRRVGSIEGFNYSAGMRSAGFTWDETHLEHWLTDTDSVVPDNNMDFHIAKADERAEIIGYLRSLSQR